MKVVVLGGNGLLGSLVAAGLTSAGHAVTVGSRRTGVDAYSGVGLSDAIRGSDAVVDCLGLQTFSARRATDFFRTTATNITRSVHAVGNAHLVTVSIINVDDPRLRRMGYYQGKTAQEAVVRAADVRSTIVRSAQWFELARQMRAALRVGPFSVIPHMRAQPLAAAAAAGFVCDVVTNQDPRPELEVAGPEQRDMAELARRLADREDPGLRVFALTPPGLGAMAHGALLPGPGATLLGPTFDEWLSGQTRHARG